MRKHAPTRVLLAASHPHGKDEHTGIPYNDALIDKAASAVIRSVLERPGLVLRFGGHPSITPLVLTTYDRLTGRRRAKIEIVQSLIFKKGYVEEAIKLFNLDNVELTETADLGERNASLALMREELIRPPLTAAFLVGGMTGIKDERDLCADRHPSARVFAFTEPGGMAAKLASGSGTEFEAPNVTPISGAAFLIEAARAVDEIAEGQP